MTDQNFGAAKNPGKRGRPRLPWKETVSRRYQFPQETAQQLSDFAKRRKLDPSVVVTLAVETYLGNYNEPTN